MASSCSAASAGALLAARPRTVISIVLAKVDDEQVTRLRTFEVHRPRERVDKIQGDVADVVANVLLMQAASPIVAALLARLLLGEAVTSRTWVAMGVALAGVGLMAGGPGGQSLGVTFAFFMLLGFAAAIVIARGRSDVSMAPGACLAQLLLVIVFAPFAHFGGISGHDVGLLALLGIGQIGLGLMFLTLGARLIPQPRSPWSRCSRSCWARSGSGSRCPNSLPRRRSRAEWQ